jgi:hypothetical protein
MPFNKKNRNYESKTAGYATWIELSTGRILVTGGKVPVGRQTLTVSPFLIDVVLKVNSSQSTKK